MITIDGKQVKLQIWDTVSTDIGEGKGRAGQIFFVQDKYGSRFLLIKQEL